jgi:hypothetical protein
VYGKIACAFAEGERIKKVSFVHGCPFTLESENPSVSIGPKGLEKRWGSSNP